MSTEQNYTAQRLFFDLRQLQSYCESGRTHAQNQQKEKSEIFYARLESRIRDMIADGKIYIAIAGSETKSPLHCINTHQFEYIDTGLAQAFNTQNLNSYAPSNAPIAGEYSFAQMLTDTDDYIAHKTQLRNSLDEKMIQNIIGHDITIKHTFRANVLSLAQSGEDAVLVPYKAGTSADRSVLDKVNDFTLN
tara:strand:- start:113820 stop:114392 length:573 start_codon:yes stop_codon:yes gene_type:complete